MAVYTSGTQRANAAQRPDTTRAGAQNDPPTPTPGVMLRLPREAATRSSAATARTSNASSRTASASCCSRVYGIRGSQLLPCKVQL